MLERVIQADQAKGASKWKYGLINHQNQFSRDFWFYYYGMMVKIPPEWKEAMQYMTTETSAEYQEFTKFKDTLSQKAFQENKTEWLRAYMGLHDHRF